jgi:hypothetical protein
MVQRGKDHLGALCVVAAHLAERAWVVFDRGMPYVICDTDALPVTPTQAKAIIAQRWTVPEQVRRRRRHKKGKALTKSCKDMYKALKAQRGDPPPRPPVLSGAATASSQPSHTLDNRSSIGNQAAAMCWMTSRVSSGTSCGGCSWPTPSHLTRVAFGMPLARTSAWS